MARNKGGGSKHKKGKSLGQVETLLLRSEEDREFYAHVIKAYGNGQFGVRLVVSDANAQLALTPKGTAAAFRAGCASRSAGTLSTRTTLC